MRENNVLEILENHQAQKEFYEITECPKFDLNNKTYQVGSMLMFVEKFIENYINNTEKEYPIYVYDIQPTNIYGINTSTIRFVEVKEIYLNKIGILRRIRINKIRKIIEDKCQLN